MNFCLLADRPAAIPTVARWYFDEWGCHQEGNSFEKTCERIRGKLNRDKAPLHVLALDSDAVVGVAQWKLYEMSEYPDKEYWLGGVYVEPASRGLGIASRLSLKVSDIAQQNGVQELYLATEHLGGGLYASAGWEPIERTVSRGDHVLVMVKKLGLY